jgi:RnfABCDGE-type electron transport complex D subunit
MQKLVYSNSPHVKVNSSTRRVMAEVAIALLPACVAGVIFFGVSSLLVLVLATVAAVAAEVVYSLCCKKTIQTIIAEFDFSSVVTGLLVGMNMYADSRWYVPVLCSIFAIVIVKMLFGGTGKNVVNPAIAGRVFGTIAFGPALLGTMAALPSIDVIANSNFLAGATPLSALFGGSVSSLGNPIDLLLGTGVAGTIGETCKIALIIGGAYLCIRGILNFRWPLVYMLVTGLVTVMLNGFNFAYFLPSILSGGLVLGAIFMATDYVTSPVTKVGNYIYFVLLGIMTAVLRNALKSEVVSYVILLGNLVVPLIDRYIVRKPFGYVKPAKEAK